MSEFKAIYLNGYLYKTEPPLNDYYNERDKFNDARFIISDGTEYDLEDIESINSIIPPAPCSEIITDTPGTCSLGIAGYLDYVLRMKASELRKRKENQLSVAVLIKACSLMQNSGIKWNKKDYMRLVDWLYEDGRFEEADQYEEKINDLFKSKRSDDSYTPSHQRQINTILSLGYDLCMTSSHLGCCGECAKRRKRVFSISGKDKRFMKYTEYKCTCSGLAILMFRENSDEHYLGADNYIEYSNRPLIDDRTDEEKAIHQFHLDKQVYESILERDKKLFYRMKTVIPDFPFKSFRSYRSCSKDKKIAFAVIAQKYGFSILPNAEEEEASERYLKAKTEKGWR